ncbi:MAG: 2-keto-4-pentenoate hydratase [Acidimicrobiia bacterium]
MSPSGTVHSDIADSLFAARASRVPIDPITETNKALDVADAYRIQQHFVARLLAAGGETVGYKLGLTSKPMQEMMGVDQPDYGPVLSSMVFDSGVEIDLESYIQPRVEAEIALVLEAPLAGPEVSLGAARLAVGGARAAIEMVDSRIKDWKIQLIDTIADLASSAATILSDQVVPIDDWDPRLCGMVISRNGKTVDTGAGAAALGDPIAAVAWLANTLSPYDLTLEPGWFIMTGALHRAFPVEPGDEVEAEFDRLGKVKARFA